MRLCQEYHEESEKCTMIVFLHVDDIVIACNDKEVMTNEKKDMEKRFEMQDLGEAHHVLGMNILKNENKDKQYYLY